MAKRSTPVKTTTRVLKLFGLLVPLVTVVVGVLEREKLSIEMDAVAIENQSHDSWRIEASVKIENTGIIPARISWGYSPITIRSLDPITGKPLDGHDPILVQFVHHGQDSNDIKMVEATSLMPKVKNEFEGVGLQIEAGYHSVLLVCYSVPPWGGKKLRWTKQRYVTIR